LQTAFEIFTRNPQVWAEEHETDLFTSNHINKSGIDNDSIAYLRMTIVDAIEQNLNCNSEPCFKSCQGISAEFQDNDSKRTGSA
jgi:hypothetical protein